MNTEYKICKRCVMDTSDSEIVFDSEGNCNNCNDAIRRLNIQLLNSQEREDALKNLVDKIKKEGKNKKYDCIIGVSGGVDSTTVAYYVKKLGLRALAVHFDNGWNSELAVDNIHKTLEILKIDLYTHVVNWEEFKDLQLSFLKASLTNAEAPTDHAINALLLKIASKENVKYVLSGSNLATEVILPISWSYYNQDLKLLKAVHRRFGRIPLKTMPTISILEYFYYVFFKGIRQIPFLNYIDYNKDAAKEMLTKELGWRDYGGKHYESVWTRFFQGYYLPTKFKFDKRRAHLSSLIVSGQITRDQALAELAKPTYDPDLLQQDMDFVIKKFGLTKEDFEALINSPIKRATDYPSNYFLFHKLVKYKNIFRKIATQA